jgi:hypothetical protein
MSGRFKSHTFQFRKPLATPESKIVYQCYATHGKGYGGSPPFNTSVHILCLSKTGEVKWTDGFYSSINGFECNAMRGVKGWAMLGWVMSDQSLPLGELDRVDPALAQYSYLPLVDDRDCSFRQFGQKD